MTAPTMPAATPPADDDGPLYHQVAKRLEGMIQKGTLGPGEKLPSVRQLSRDWAVSITTVLESYRLLENRGLIEVRPQSGHYVRPRLTAQLPEIAMERMRIRPTTVSLGDLSVMTLHDSQDPDLTHFGAAVPNPALLPSEKLNRTMAAVARRQPARATAYEFPPGAKAYRIEVARRAVTAGCALTPDEIMATNGCTSSLWLCLRLLCRPGDAVAVESPTYYGMLRSLEAMGIQAIEIPTHPADGISLEALQYALDQHRISAVLLTPNFSNPLGSMMPESRKEELVAMLAEREIPLIEDDVYGDICFDDERPKVCKAYDRKGLVLLCSSFSKTLAPGYRVGWVAGGRFQKDLLRLNVMNTLATPTLTQLAVAEFLANGGYEHHLRRIRRVLIQQMAWLQKTVARHFPEGTRMTQPRGGFVLWVSLPEQVDTLVLYERALQHRISISPGVLFSAKGQYRHCVRLNAAFAMEDTEAKVATLGALARELAAAPAAVRSA
jgi:DNA-binding transcriptional MocR family regulator